MLQADRVGILLVSGTGFGVGKTVVTAALASRAAARRGHRVAVVKPVQAGTPPDAAGDLAVVTRLSGVTTTSELARYPAPLPPRHAAAASGRPELPLADVVRHVVDLDATHDTVLVEGSGGLLVPFTSGDRWTVADLAAALRAPVLVVAGVGSDAGNDVALASGRLAEDGIVSAGVVIGRWPENPDAVARCAVADLAELARDGRLGGALPEGAASAPDFRQVARAGLAARFGGTFDPVTFVARQRAAGFAG